MLTVDQVEDLARTAVRSLRAYGVHEYTFGSRTPHDRREWLRGYVAALTVVIKLMTGDSYPTINLRLNQATQEPTQ